MTLTTHTAIGAAIGFNIGHPVAGFFLGLISHFLVDMIPHGDIQLARDYFQKKQRKRMAMSYTTIDGAVSIFLLLFLFNVGGFESKLAFSAAIAGSVLPDLLVGTYEFTKFKYLRWFPKFHFFFHDFFYKSWGDVKLTHALLGQAVFIILLMRGLIY